MNDNKSITNSVIAFIDNAIDRSLRLSHDNDDITREQFKMLKKDISETITMAYDMNDRLVKYKIEVLGESKWSTK